MQEGVNLEGACCAGRGSVDHMYLCQFSVMVCQVSRVSNDENQAVPLFGSVCAFDCLEKEPIPESKIRYGIESATDKS